MTQRMSASGVSDPFSVFLNIPYDVRFGKLYLAYIAGLSAFGLVPRATVEIPGGDRRLNRIFDLIKTCRYSVHDLSRVQLDHHPPPTPRFNMPFELGLAIAWTNLQKQADSWFVFETMKRRLQKSLSDLDGTDVYVHDGTVSGVFRELTNAFVRNKRQPTMKQMQAVYEALHRAIPRIKRDAGARNLFSARVFKELIIISRVSLT
ncbi:MAG TPA: hypothetical protein VG028_12290 [Terriglobia bacterium]|nr:hypothetical protein [Terriglobia bacterium]